MPDVTLNDSGQVGNNAQSGGGDVAGRDIKKWIINIFGSNTNNQKSEILTVVKTLNSNYKSVYKTDEMKTSNPDWEEKIEYNQLKTWNKIFDGWSSALVGFEENIITNLDTPDILLKSLYSEYLRLDHSFTSDEKCSELRKSLLHMVNQGRSKKISSEIKSAGVELTIYWAFTRCQILENPSH